MSASGRRTHHSGPASVVALPDIRLHSGGGRSVTQSKFQEQPVWLWPNLLSLDAPLIAVLWLHLFALSAGVELSWSVTLVLALTVWVIYVTDRLFDGLHADPLTYESARHRFHRAHRSSLLPLLIAALALAVWTCLKLDFRTLQGGTLLMLCVAGYFCAVHWVGSRWRFPKEPVVAIVFGIGTVFPVWIHTQRVSAAMAAAIALFILVCWLNVELIEYSEWLGTGRSQTEMPHAVTRVAGRNLLPLSAGIAIGATMLSLALPLRVEQPALLAVALSAAALGVLAHYRHRLSLNMVRALADAALLSPVVMLLFKH